MNRILQTGQFCQWLKKLRDIKGKTAILKRIERAKLGNFGDTRPVGEEVREMRFFVGPGYRVYYVHHKEVIYILLCGGDKNTQESDIPKAIQLWREIREGIDD